MVVDLPTLFKEIDALESRGVSCSRLKVSSLAHLIFPWHQAHDAISEKNLGDNKIGTTLKGIGPAYADKINRIGIRVQDLFDTSILRQKLEGALRDKNQVLIKVFNRKGIEIDEVLNEYLGYAEILKPYVCDTSLLLEEALKANNFHLEDERPPKEPELLYCNCPYDPLGVTVAGSP